MLTLFLHSNVLLLLTYIHKKQSCYGVDIENRGRRGNGGLVCYAMVTNTSYFVRYGVNKFAYKSPTPQLADFCYDLDSDHHGGVQQVYLIPRQSFPLPPTKTCFTEPESLVVKV